MSLNVRITAIPRGGYCCRGRLTRGTVGEFYHCVLTINRVVSFRKSEQHPWVPAVRVCHLCAMGIAEQDHSPARPEELGA